MADKNIFVLDDGTKEITIVNKYQEEICKIHIRGGDLSILDRYQKLTNDFDTIVAPLASVQLKNDGTTSFDDDWKTVKAVEQELIERINQIFDTTDAGKLFEKRNAFSSVDGEFYVEKVISMLGDIVAKEMSREAEKAQKRIDKYTKDIKK